MIYTDSICFSADKAEELNSKAFSLDKRLFLFAYYEPKPYISQESARSRFCTAVINIYGLFWDCSPFFKFLLKPPGSILLKKDWKKTKKNFDELYCIVSAFRSMFCHNNSLEFPLNEDDRNSAETWVEQKLLDTKFEGIETLDESHWEKLLITLCTIADSIMEDLKNNLDMLNTTTDTSRKAQTIEQWIQAIANSYSRNPNYLLNTMAEMYRTYSWNMRIHDTLPLDRKSVV